MANWLLLAMLLRISDAARRPATRQRRRAAGTARPRRRPHRRSCTSAIDGGDQAVNAPLRKAGVVMMVLFGLLFANLNWVRRTRPTSTAPSDVQRPGAGQQRVRAPARQIIESTARRSRSSVETKDTLKYLRSTRRARCTPTSSATSRSTSAPTGIERLENEFLTGTADAFVADRLLRHVHRQEDHRRQRRADAQDAGAGGGVQRADQQRARRPRRAPWWRSTRRPARSWRWSPCPSYDPNPLVSHDYDGGPGGVRQARQGPGQAAAEPGAVARPSRPARRSR